MIGRWLKQPKPLSSMERASYYMSNWNTEKLGKVESFISGDFTTEYGKSLYLYIRMEDAMINAGQIKVEIYDPLNTTVSNLGTHCGKKHETERS